MNAIAEALALGFGFGWLLQKAGLTEYRRIVGVYRLKDATVIRFMLAALVVAAFLVQAAVELDLAAPLPIPPTHAAANLVGGVIFGIGMATAGQCTGTVVARAGEGGIDAWLGGFPGLITGAILFALWEPRGMAALARWGDLGRTTFAILLQADPGLVLIVFAEIVALVLYALTPRRSAA